MSTKRKFLRALLCLAILAVAVGGTAVMVSLKPPPEKKVSTRQDILVDVQPLTAASVSFVVDSQGTVQPRTETVLVAEVAGPIVSLSPKFVAGGVFAANEELMRVDQAIFRITVEQARAVLAQRQIEFDGAQSLKERGYRAEAELAAAGAALATAKADLARAERDLDRTSIRLPYAGMVRARSADVGQYVTPGTQLGTAFATDYAEVRLPLTDADLAFLNVPPADTVGRPNDTAPTVTLSAVVRGKPREWQARLTRGEGVIDERTRVTFAVARIDDPYGFASADPAAVALPIGTFVSASIQGVTRDDVIRVPRAALRGGAQLLFVDDDNRLDIRTVEVLRTDSSYAYVTGGAAPGERITATTIEAPINGMRVRINGEPRDAEATEEAAGAGRQLSSAEAP
ncbi:MAG: efflux RND transporter periplasmic adaptor subunit [Pseudomonadota bacterium]